MARTRNFAECGSDEEMRWPALHPSSMAIHYRDMVMGDVDLSSLTDRGGVLRFLPT